VRLGPRAKVHVERDRDGGTASERLEGWTEACFGQDGGVDTAGDLPQLVQRSLQAVDDERLLAPELVRGTRCQLLGDAGRQRKGDQALLDAVMQVTLHSPTRLVRGRHDTSP